MLTRVVAIGIILTTYLLIAGIPFTIEDTTIYSSNHPATDSGQEKLLVSKECSFVDYKNGLAVVSWSPDGEYIAVSRRLIELDVIDIYCRVIWKKTLESKRIESITWSPLGDYIAVSASIMLNPSKSYVYLFSRGGTELWSIEVHGEITSVSWSTDNNIIAVSYYIGTNNNSKLLFIDRNGEIVYSRSYSGKIKSVSWSTDGEYIAVLKSSGDLILYGRDIEKLWSTKNVYMFKWANNRIVASLGGSIEAISLNGEVLWKKTFSYLINSFSIDPSSRYIVVLTADMQLSLIGINGDILWSMDLNRVFGVENYYVRDSVIQWSSDGRYFILAIDYTHTILTFKDIACIFDLNGSLLWKTKSEDNIDSVYWSKRVEYIAIRYSMRALNIYRLFSGIKVELYGYRKTYALLNDATITLPYTGRFEPGEYTVVFTVRNCRREFTVRLEYLRWTRLIVYYGLRVSTSEWVLYNYSEVLANNLAIIVINNLDVVSKIIVDNKSIGIPFGFKQLVLFVEAGKNYTVTIEPSRIEYLKQRYTLEASPGAVYNLVPHRKPLLKVSVGTNSLFNHYYVVVNNSVMGMYRTGLVNNIFVNGTGLFNVTIYTNVHNVIGYTKLLYLEPDTNYSISLELYTVIRGNSLEYILLPSDREFVKRWCRENGYGVLISSFDCRYELVVNNVSVPACGNYILPVGKYSVSLVSLNYSYSSTIDIMSGRVTVIKPATLVLRVNVDSIAYIDNRSVGVIVAGVDYPIEVLPGYHVVVFKHASGWYIACINRSVSVGFNDRVVVEARFFSLVIENVSGRLYVDGVFVGRYNGSRVEVYVAPGKHVVRIEPDNVLYDVYEEEVDVYRDNVLVAVKPRPNTALYYLGVFLIANTLLSITLYTRSSSRLRPLYFIYVFLVYTPVILNPLLITLLLLTHPCSHLIGEYPSITAMLALIDLIIYALALYKLQSIRFRVEEAIRDRQLHYFTIPSVMALPVILVIYNILYTKGVISDPLVLVVPAYILLLIAIFVIKLVIEAIVPKRMLRTRV